jgi:hypothetical protein
LRNGIETATELRGGAFPFCARARWFNKHESSKELQQASSNTDLSSELQPELSDSGSDPPSQHRDKPCHDGIANPSEPSRSGVPASGSAPVGNEFAAGAATAGSTGSLSDDSTSAKSRAAGNDVFEAVQQALLQLSAACKKLTSSEKVLIARALQSSSEQLGSEFLESSHTDAPQVLHTASVTEPAAHETTVAPAVSGSGSDSDAASSKVLLADEVLKGSDVSLTAAELEKLVELMLDDTMSTDEFKTRALRDSRESHAAAGWKGLKNCALSFVQAQLREKQLHKSMLQQVTIQLDCNLNQAVSVKAIRADALPWCFNALRCCT